MAILRPVRRASFAGCPALLRLFRAPAAPPRPTRAGCRERVAQHRAQRRSSRRGRGTPAPRRVPPPLRAANMPEASGSGSAPDGSLLAADESSSPITQVAALGVASDAPAQRPQSSAPPPRRGFVAALLRCCGRMPDEGADHSQRPLNRTLYIPPAPHTGQPFIPPLLEGDKGKKTLVLDLDETLVHSSFKPVPNPDYIIPVEIDGKARGGAHAASRAASRASARPTRSGEALAAPQPLRDGRARSARAAPRLTRAHPCRARLRRSRTCTCSSAPGLTSSWCALPARPSCPSAPARGALTRRSPGGGGLAVRGDSLHRQPGQVRRPAA